MTTTPRKQPKGDRHIGKRVEFYLPVEEYEKFILQGMRILHEKNKSVYIRSALRSYADYLKKKNTEK